MLSCNTTAARRSCNSDCIGITSFSLQTRVAADDTDHYTEPQDETSLSSAWKSDTASKAFRFYYWITLSRTQSSHLLPQRREASHHSWVRPSKCAYRGPVEIISWAQSARWRDQYMMFVWMAGNFVFHRDHLKQTSLPLLLECSLLISEEKRFDSVNSRVFLLWLMRFRTICRKCEGEKRHSWSCENLWQPLNLLSSAAQGKVYLWFP